ncbi:MAG: c-type cytochrome [Steroidobacteraceae bacterium]
MRKQGTRLLLALLGASAAGCTPSAPAPAADAGVRSDASAGARIYSGNCMPCHQEDGRGIAGVFPSLAGSPVVLGDSGAFARWVARGQRPDGMPAGRYAATMPQFGWMTAGDTAALLTYLRSHFGNAAPPVSAAAVAAALGD